MYNTLEKKEYILPSHRPGSHNPGGGEDIVHGDVAVVLDVLHLLPVPGRLLQGLDDQGRGGGNHRHLIKRKLFQERNFYFRTDQMMYKRASFRKSIARKSYLQSIALYSSFIHILNMHKI